MSSDAASSRSVVVIGGGLVGTCQARALAKRGWNVILMERNMSLADETSRANAGRFAASAMTRGPIAKPGWENFKHTFEMLTAPTTVISSSLIKWGLHYLRNCMPTRHENNVSAFRWLRDVCIAEMDAIFGEVDGLTRHCMRNEHGVYVHGDAMSRPATDGFEKALDCDACKRLIPALRDHPSMSGCYFLTRDYTVDARKFTTRVAKDAALKYGVRTVFGATAVALERDPNDSSKITAVHAELVDGEAARIETDAVVLCPGASAARQSMSLLGYWIPVEPMRGVLHFTRELPWRHSCHCCARSHVWVGLPGNPL